MKMKHVLFFFFLTSSLLTMGQVQHVQGIKSVDLAYGISKYGTIYSISYVRYFSNKIYGKATLFYEKGIYKEATIEYVSAGSDILVAYNLFKAGESLYLNAIGGITVSGDRQSNGGGTGGVTIPSATKFGVLGGFEIEAFISQKFVFILTCEQKLLINGDFGSNRWIVTGGIRYNF